MTKKTLKTIFQITFSTAPLGRGNRSPILYIHKLPLTLARGFCMLESYLIIYCSN